MGWFNRTTTEAAMKGTLTADERIALTRLEAAVDAGVQATMTVLEAGKALSEIRSRQLYRDTSSTWDSYVKGRFKITRRRADQLVSFAGVKAALDELGTQVPEISEKAARPLVGLPQDAVAQVIAEASESAEGVTAGSIRKAASKRRGKKALKIPRPVRLKVPGAVIEIALNRKGVLAGVTVEAALEAALDACRQQAEAA